MYKIKTSLLACSVLFLIAACANDPERHIIELEKPSLVLYADQTTGSVSFYTYDSWTVEPQDEWITVYGDSHLDIDYDYMNLYLSTVSFVVQPNATGKTRYGTVLIKSYYDAAVPFYQLGVLNVLHPNKIVGTLLDERGSIPDVAHYELVDSAHWEKDSICFKVENDWTLEFAGEAPEWIELVGNTTGSPGKNRVDFNLTPNTDTENGREAKLKLKSSGVSNEIVVCQLPAKKEEEE